MSLIDAICCFWLGKHEEAIRVNDRIAANAGVPSNVAEAARHNREKSQESLAANHASH